MMEANILSKSIIFHKRALEIIRGFSRSARTDIGELLYELQRAENIGMPDAGPMPTIAGGAYEMRVKDSDGIYRVFYYLKSAEGIWYFMLSQRKRRLLHRTRS